MKTVMLWVGTRPEAIKMCPLALALAKREGLRTVLGLTGQHRDLVTPVLEAFGVKASYDLSVMREGQGLSSLTAALLTGVEGVLRKERPALVLVHGDTASALACALAAFYERIPVWHVEAGLRTYDLAAPFPEEMNRQVIGRLSSLDFAPTERARENLLREGKSVDRVIVTGNTVADALAFTVRADFDHPLWWQVAGHPLVLFTCHRRENRERMGGLFTALRRVAAAFPRHRFLFPLHPDPAVREMAFRSLTGETNVILTESLDVVTLHNLLARCEMVVTDSGGLQEEALCLHRPVAVLREVTERPEGLLTGGAVLLGTHPEAVEEGLLRLLSHPAVIQKRAALPSPYGEAGASEIIADAVARFLG